MKGHIPPWIARVLGAAYLLTMTKLLEWNSSHCSGGNIVSIHKLHLMFHNAFVTHLSLH